MKMNKGASSSNNSQKRAGNPNIMYQEYLYQKSRSPQNQSNPGKIDYYKIINSTQSNFPIKQNPSAY